MRTIVVFENLTREHCLSIGGEYEGNGSSCDDEPCTPIAIGSCCLGDGLLCDEVPELHCITFGGTFNGNDTLCSDSPCVLVSTGWLLCFRKLFTTD